MRRTQRKLVAFTSKISGSLAGRWLGTTHSAAMRVGLAVCLPRRKPSHYLRLLRTPRAKIRELLVHPAMTEEDLKILNRIVAHCDVIESRWDFLEEMCSDLRPTPGLLRFRAVFDGGNE